MALKAIESTGGDFLDLREVAQDGPVLAIARIGEFQDPEKGDFGWLLPVIADWFIVDGDRAGQVHLAERNIGGITSALRGVRNPNAQKNERPSTPVNSVGDELVIRLTLKNAGKANSFVVGDKPSDSEYTAAGKAYEEAGGPRLWEGQLEPVGAGAGAGAGAAKSARPWG